MLTFGCVVTAAGRGERLGGTAPKALQEIGGVPMLTHAVMSLAAHDQVVSIVVTAPPDHLQQTKDAVATVTHPDLQVVVGGHTRTDSVRAGVAALPADVAGVRARRSPPLRPARHRGHRRRSRDRGRSRSDPGDRRGGHHQGRRGR